MENYRLLERLGKGGQGSVYFAENKIDGTKCVLKKVECHDESEANQAFREALVLQQLQHPYVCGYKEFFVMWDKEECAMFVCIVMEHYVNGDLKKIIHKFQEQKQPIDERIVKMYLGEIIEALIFVHGKGILHRDLKPSNIFVKEDHTLCLGDFGVSTIIGDARTNTRSPAGTTNYMAPEIMDGDFDERSDLWSLGCILFELTTTALLDGSAVVTKLREIKENSVVLEEIFEDIATHFSAELIKTIRGMLKSNPSQRSTPEELLGSSPYIRSCVNVSDSNLLEKRKRQLQSADEKDKPVDKDRMGLLAVLEHLANTIDHEDCVKESLEHLLDLLKQQDNLLLDDNSKRLVVCAMTNNFTEESVQIVGCEVLSQLVLSAEAQDILYSPEVIIVVPKAMKTHADSAELQQAATALLMALSAEKRAAEVIGEMGGIKLIMAAMRSNPKNYPLLSTCCSALWSLTVIENNMMLASEEKAIVEITKALKTHLSYPDLAEAACAAFVPLCLDDGIFEYVNDLDCVGVIINALETHIKMPKVVKNACMALAGLSEPNEECAFRLLAGDDPSAESTPGIPVVMQAYELHKDNAEVVEAIVDLFMELTQYDDICKDMLSYKTTTMLKEMRKKFAKNQNIMEPCEQALEKLSEGSVKQKGLGSMAKA